MWLEIVCASVWPHNFHYYPGKKSKKEAKYSNIDYQQHIYNAYAK